MKWKMLNLAISAVNQIIWNRVLARAIHGRSRRGEGKSKHKRNWRKPGICHWFWWRSFRWLPIPPAFFRWGFSFVEDEFRVTPMQLVSGTRAKRRWARVDWALMNWAWDCNHLLEHLTPPILPGTLPTQPNESAILFLQIFQSFSNSLKIWTNSKISREILEILKSLLKILKTVSFFRKFQIFHMNHLTLYQEFMKFRYCYMHFLWKFHNSKYFL